MTASTRSASATERQNGIITTIGSPTASAAVLAFRSKRASKGAPITEASQKSGMQTAAAQTPPAPRSSMALPVDPQLLNDLPELKGVVPWRILGQVKTAYSQAAAAVGQIALANAWAEALGRLGIVRQRQHIAVPPEPLQRGLRIALAQGAGKHLGQRGALPGGHEDEAPGQQLQVVGCGRGRGQDGLGLSGIRARFHEALGQHGLARLDQLADDKGPVRGGLCGGGHGRV